MTAHFVKGVQRCLDLCPAFAARPSQPGRLSPAVSARPSQHKFISWRKFSVFVFLSILFQLTTINSFASVTTISGTVSLQNVAAGNYGQPLVFVLTGTTTGIVTTQTVTLAPADGSFTLANVPSGAYTLSVKGSKWLRTNVAVSTTGGSITGLNVPLRGGDVDGDNQDNEADFTALRTAYRSNPSSANWNIGADLNCDGQVSLTDFIILRSNYMTNGDALPIVLSRVTVAPTTVTGGTSSTGTVTLSGPAPTGGSTVSLSSSSLSTTVPPIVIVAAGATTATFPITTSSVTSATTATISATAGGITQTAGLTINPVVTTPPYISGLTLTNPAMPGGSNTTATLTLSGPAPAGGASVTIKSSNSALTVPTSVVVPAASSSMTFAISSTSVTAPTQINVSCSYGGWIQSATLVLLPAGQSLSVQSLKADGGNASVILSWMTLPEGSVRGYKIYRVLGSTNTLLNAVPQISNFYADMNLTNGNNYQYRVSTVDTLGSESTLSAPVNATPSASFPTVNWISPPTTTVSGQVPLYASTSINSSPVGLLFVDGKLLGEGGSVEHGSPAGSSIEAVLDTAGLSNGTHTVQIIAVVNDAYCASQSLILQVNNQFSNFSSDDAFQQDQGELLNITATVPANSQQWTLQIINDNDSSIVRSWQGVTPNISLAWDGTNSTGAIATEGNYTIQITAQLPSGSANASAPSAQGASSVLTHKPVTMVKGFPQALVLISKISTNTATDQQLANTIKTQLGIIAASNPGFRFAVLVSKGSASTKLRLQIKSWMTNSVTDFYLWGHGFALQPNSIPGGEWAGGINFISSNNLPTNSSILRTSITNPELMFIIPNMVHRQYNFVMMDTCVSAGLGTPAFPGSDISDPATPNDSWATAFQIGTNQDFSSCFFGWNGSAGFNSFTDGTLSNWEIWRELFWKHLAAGGTVYQSATWASQHYVGASFAINPWDTNRAEEVGDTTLP